MRVPGGWRSIDPDVTIAAIDQYRSQISRMIGTGHLDPTDENRTARASESEWLRLIYERYLTLAFGDMDRAWGILQIFVPVAVAPFAALAAFDDLTRLQLSGLAVASTVVLLAANLMVDRIKQHESRTWHVIRAIEAEIGLDGLGDGWRLAGGELRGVPFRTVRWLLLLLILGAWCVLIAAA